MKFLSYSFSDLFWTYIYFGNPVFIQLVKGFLWILLGSHFEGGLIINFFILHETSFFFLMIINK